MSEAKLDPIDRAIVVATQDGLPLVDKPYHDVARQVGVSPDEVMSRMERMLAEGIIRRMGVVPNHYALGYKFNGMTVWDVADEDIAEAGRRVGELDFVSHCYHRPRHLPDWPYSLFAMIHAKEKAGADALVERVAEVLGDLSRGHMVLFSSRILKKTGLRL
ncbi:siroheme decarboxylase subunit beta [Paramagnetospirillum magneticum]|uniref:siroheme decarboxylase n=1 Tax=Paramagnetospirillum magneticum (strain ATCC 700264 / AMB-1) TaxID=342108 RepID=Q2W7G4_PARM1|nr:AsnC family transcriptional regulator [Paramagnetospirillum magneticum]BAE50211.1 Transcriptional regulator [Paramagnetospirillum magneticum AMB-1]